MTTPDDLVERLKINGRSDELNPLLRNKNVSFSQREAIEVTQELCMKAAAEIERLRAENKEILDHDRAAEMKAIADAERAEAERDALRADAERYRWLRLASSERKPFYEPGPRWMVSVEGAGMGQNYFGEKIDAAIDAARSKP